MDGIWQLENEQVFLTLICKIINVVSLLKIYYWNIYVNTKKMGMYIQIQPSTVICQILTSPIHNLLLNCLKNNYLFHFFVKWFTIYWILCNYVTYETQRISNVHILSIVILHYNILLDSLLNAKSSLTWVFSRSFLVLCAQATEKLLLKWVKLLHTEVNLLI